MFIIRIAEIHKKLPKPFMKRSAAICLKLKQRDLIRNRIVR